MKLSEMNITAFVELLGSNEPAPGGGSTAALAGSLGISLLQMVAALTTGREKYKEHEPLMIEIVDKAKEKAMQFLDLMDKDTEAYNGVTAVFKMPKNTEEEKAARSTAMQEALKNSTLSPFRMMETSLEALELAKSALGKINTNAASDLGVCALNLKTAVQGAWLNVKINLPGLKDKEFAAKYEAEGKVLLEKSMALADEIYHEVLAGL